MIESILGCLFVGWILSFFGFDHFVINGFNELFKVNMTEFGYYLIFATIGVLENLCHGN